MSCVVHQFPAATLINRWGISSLSGLLAILGWIQRTRSFILDFMGWSLQCAESPLSRMNANQGQIDSAESLHLWGESSPWVWNWWRHCSSSAFQTHILWHREVGGREIWVNRAPLCPFLCLLLSSEPELKPQQKLQAYSSSHGSWGQLHRTTCHLQLHISTFSDIYTPNQDKNWGLQCSLPHKAWECFRVRQLIAVVPFAQQNRIKLCPWEHPELLRTARRDSAPCGRVYKALNLEINLSVVLLTPSDYAAISVK